MTKDEYSEYLKSEHWKNLRSKKKKNRCAICGSEENLQVHHLVYRHIFDVTKGDLRKLCRECHETAHILIKSGTLVFRSENTHSRFSITKAAVKKSRFGSAIASPERHKNQMNMDL
jgi:hypothetical protein